MIGRRDGLYYKAVFCTAATKRGGSGMGDWHWGFGFGHWFFGILFWIVVLVILVGLVRAAGGFRSDTRRRDKTALEILEERYARGEIDQEEFERKKRDLS